MGVHLAANWPDLMEKDLRKVYIDNYAGLPAMVPDLFNVQSTMDGYEKISSASPVPDHVEFAGKVSVVQRYQGYDKTATFTEYAAQIQVQRKLAADDANRTVNRFPKGLAESAKRSREKLGANVFNLAFTYEPTDGDGAELCASDHPSTVPNVTAQNNEGALSMSAANIETVRQNMLDFTDLGGETITVEPDTLICYKDNEETGYEIINSKGKVETADNNVNFHYGKYKLIVWNRLTTSNWFVVDYDRMKDYLVWWNREPIQFMQDSDSDTHIAKYLSYYRCGTSWDDWPWIYGLQP